MGIFKISNIKINIFLEIILCKILFILGKDNIINKNTIIIEVKQKLMDKSFEDEEIKAKNYYNLIVNKLVPNNLYLEFKINSEKAKIPGYLTFTSQYNYYGLDTCINSENDNTFNISSNFYNLPYLQLFNNEYQKYYYIKENISISDIKNYSINMNNIEIIIPETNEKQTKCLIVGLNQIRDLQQNMGIKNLPLLIKSNEKIKNLQNEAWNTDAKAWESATQANTLSAYRKYLDLYPKGAHRDIADKKIIDLEVQKVVGSGNYGYLPPSQKTSYGSGSKNSVYIKNSSSSTITVLYSGTKSTRIVLSPHTSKTVNMPSGRYQVVATASGVIPFYGTENLTGGSYESEYYITTTRY